MILDVRLEGYEAPIGYLEGERSGAVTFAYDADYQSRQDALPLSLALPLDGGLYTDVRAHAFFDNLLAGMHSVRINDQWRIVFRWTGADAEDVRVTDYH